MQLKVCGMRDPENIRQLLQLKPDYMGFIFFDKSPRHVGEVLDESLLKSFPSHTQKVGVFVNAPIEYLKARVSQYELDLVQLHGDESVDYVAELYAVGIRVMKVFSVGESFDFSILGQYNPFVEFFLFDTKGKARGGTGKTFDWNILKGYDLEVPFFLSGGIDLTNLSDLQVLEGLPVQALDVNSRFELAPGLKDIEKVARLTEELNKG